MEIEHGDRVVHMRTGASGVVCGIRESGQIIAGDAQGHHFAATLDELGPADLEQGIIWMRRDFGTWVPTLAKLLRETECCCGRRVAVQDEVTQFECAYCMAHRLLDWYYPLAPRILVAQGGNDYMRTLAEAMNQAGRRVQEFFDKAGLGDYFKQLMEQQKRET